MTRLLVPILLVLLALMLLPSNAGAPAADLTQEIRVLGYEVRVGFSIRPVGTSPVAESPVTVPATARDTIHVARQEVSR